jgi:hypothetical protein
MSVLSFLNDLGIIPNEGTGLEKDINLLQGQKYMEYSRVYNKSVEPHLKNLQMTSLPNVTSVIEGMHADNSVNSRAPMSKTEISKNENEFNKTMIEYSSIYKQLSEQGHMPHNRIHDKELNIKLLKKLDYLNKKLINLSEQIVKEVERDTKKQKASHNKENKHHIDEIHRKIDEKRKHFNDYIHKLKLEQKQFDKDSMNTLIGQEESSRFDLISNLYKYVLFMLLLFVIIIVFINVQTNSSSTTDLVLIILICLLGAFFIKNNFF